MARGLWWCLCATLVAAASAQNPFTLQEAVTGQFSQRGFNGRWISDTEFTFTVEDEDDTGIYVFDVPTLEPRVLVAHDLMQRLSTSNPILSADRQYILASSDVRQVYRYSRTATYTLYDIANDQAVETRHALHGVTWPVSNPKTLQVDFSSEEAFEKARTSEEAEGLPTSTIPGTVEDWLREQDLKRERGELDKPWERKAAMREWDVGKNDKDSKEKDGRPRKDERPLDKRRHRSQERSPEPARKFKKKEEEAPAKLLDDLFRKTKATPCIYWLPLSAETIAIKEEQRRQHMAEHERRMQELRRPQPRRH